MFDGLDLGGKGGNLYDLTEIHLVRFWHIRCNKTKQKDALVEKLKRFDLREVQLKRFWFNRIRVYTLLINVLFDNTCHWTE